MVATINVITITMVVSATIGVSSKMYSCAQIAQLVGAGLRYPAPQNPPKSDFFNDKQHYGKKESTSAGRVVL
ncbi:hypothetical protein C7475_109199 [Chitinophaga sp. S165]|nr:hypothetical protein C7475_109199 [Chitinophaga sp. S165]